MARRKRESYFTPTIERTIERVAIAALAAIASRATAESVAQAAVIIFVIVAVGEELGRGIMVRGKRVSLRDLVAGRIAKSGVQRARSGRSNRSRKGRSKPRRRPRNKTVDESHTAKQ